LESFTSAEVLEGENAYGCEECTRREVARLTEERRLALGRTTKCDMASNVSGHGPECGALSCCIESGADKTPSCSLDNALRPVLHASDQLQEHMPSSQVVGGRSHTHELLSSSPVTSRESSVGGRSELDSCSARSEDSDKEDDERQRKMPEVKIPTIRSRAEKLFLIKDAPRALIIHLKRFTQVGFRGGLRKISGHVDFPMELDLSPFVESTHQQGSSLTAVSPATVNPIYLPSKESKSEGLGRQRNTVADRKAVKDEFTYRLTGVCVHGGSLHGGHYTAYVRESVNRDCPGGWFHCSDSSVTRVTEEEVLASEAFLLFYERLHF
jgi:ubiquitin C-terminal hydrolase